jgi:hypothetical protein
MTDWFVRTFAMGTLSLAVGACSDAAPSSGTGEVRDSAGVRVIDLAGVDGVPERELTFDSTWGPNQDLLLGDPVYLDVASAGLVTLLDPMSTRVIVLSASGEVEATFGRSGEGPGEFSEFLAGIVSTDSTILVADLNLQRLTRFTLDGRLLGSRKLTGAGPAGVGVYGRDWRSYPGGGVAFREFSDSGDILIRWNDEDIGILHGVPFPEREEFLMPTVLWDVDASGRVVVARSDGYRVEAWIPSSPSPEWVAVGNERMSGLDDQEREHLIALVLEVLGRQNVPPDQAALVVERLEFPNRAPVLAGLLVAPDGAVWVQHALPVLQMGRAALQIGTTDGIGARRWDVMTPDGLPREVVLMPEGFSPRRFLDGWLYGLRTDGVGTTTVARVSWDGDHRF